MTIRRLNLCLIMGALRSPEGDASGGGGGGASGSAPSGGTTTSTEGAAPARTFTQAEVDQIVQGRVRKLNDEITKTRTEIESYRGKLNEFDQVRAKLEELEAKSHEGKPAHEQELIKVTRERTRLEQQLKEQAALLEAAKSEATKHQQALSDHVVKDALVSALAKGKALVSAMSHAVAVFRSEANARIEDGKVVVTVDGMDFTGNVDEAATRWLAKNPHFRSHPGGGAGLQNGSGTSTPVEQYGENAGALLGAGLSTKPPG